MFFYLYMVTVFLEMLLITGIIPTSSSVYPVSTEKSMEKEEGRTADASC